MLVLLRDMDTETCKRWRWAASDWGSAGQLCMFMQLQTMDGWLVGWL